MAEQTHSNSNSNSTLSLFDYIEDLTIKKADSKKVAVCTLCFRKSMKYIHSNKKTAVKLCLTCDAYLCNYCADDHTCKRCMPASQVDILAEKLVDEILSENDIEEKLSKNNICVLDRVHVATSMDKWLCDITGLCGLGDLHWVACDSRNFSIKIFSWKDSALKRYIRFKCKPYDVTEINLSSHRKDSDKTKKGNSNIQIEDYLNSIAITFPVEHTVLILDIRGGQVIKKKELKLEQHCFSIEFQDDKLFIVCKDNIQTNNDYMYNYVVCIKSLDGDTFKIIRTNVNSIFPPYIQVHGNDMYVTSNWNHSILLINDEGSIIHERQFEGFGPRGITVDTQNNVYVAGHWSGKIYKLNKELDQCNPLELVNIEGKVNMEKAWALCFHKEKLLVGHWTSPLENYVTIIGLL